ncbi:MAG: putative toxin-antitoxin system toxin component, PIN family [Thermoflexales bacterium]|nr:putative toxin-antitoxin system toxin component, PIN family [Thermoflexales bacterium]
MRITLDTNQLVRALVRPPELATFVMAWEARRFSLVCSPSLLEEYERVLAYPDIANLIYPELLRAFRSHLVQDIEVVAAPEMVPICRDPDDDKVIAAAIYGAVDYLVTEDGDLKEDAVARALKDAGITVISMSDLIKLLDWA